MRKYLLLTIILSCLKIDVRGDDIDNWTTVKTWVNGLLTNLPEATTAQSLRYWFDDDIGTNVQTLNVLDGSSVNINASSLVDGIHILHYQVVDSKGIAGITASKLFIRTSETPQASKIRYWFDDAQSTSTTIDNLNGVSTIDASSLVDGIHILHYQVVDSKGGVYIPVSKMFIKAGAKLTATKLLYWFDDEKSGAAETALSYDVMTVDASALVDGIHTLHYQVVDSKGDADIPVSRMFMKLGATVAAKATGIQYWFDENDALIKESDIENLTTTVDASGLALGEHVLHYQLKLSDGTLSPAASATFNTTQVLKGDANNDQKVNVADIVVIQIFIGDNTKPIHGANADANNDNVINADDVETVKDIIMTPKE